MADVYSSCGCGTNCGDTPNVRVVAGNDLTVEAVVSVWDAKECVYVPMDLTGASDVALNMVTTYTKVPGEEVSASGSRVSAFFPAGRLGKGVYGVEITFRDADGRCRAFERSLIEVVESSGEATVESTAEGETGDGLNITVDVRTRTVRIGGTGATDYPSLTGKPSINGVVLEGDKTPEELGMYSKRETDEKFQTKESAVEADKHVQGMLDGKVDKEPGKGLSANDLTDERAGKVDMLEKDGRANEHLNGAGTYSRPVRQGYGVSVADDNTVSVDPQVIARQSDVANVAANLAAQKAKEQGDIDRANAAISKEETDRKAAVAVLQSLIDILNSDSNVDGSVKKTVADAIARVVAGAPEDLDTLKEIADYIASDKTGAAQMAAAISQLQTLTEKHTSDIAGNASGVAENKAGVAALNTLAAGHTKSIEDLGKVKADKADVEPYDCTWAFRLANGAEVTRDQVIELDTAVRSGRPLYVISFKQKASSVIGMTDNSSDNYSEIVLLMYTYSSGGLRCVISDQDMVDDGHYMEANISYWGFQQRLVSGTNIKTINGVPVLGAGNIKTPAPTKVSELENDTGYLTKHQSLEGYYQKTEASLDHRVVAEAIVSLAARLDALEGSRGLLGDATAGTVDVRGLTRCRYPLVMLGHGVPAEANVPVNLPDGLPWDGVPAFAGQQYINLDAASDGLYYAAGVDSVADWKQA